MYRRCLIALFLVIFLVGCSTQTIKKADKIQNVTPDGVRIIQDVVYGHKYGMALTFDLYQPKNPNGAGVIRISSGGWVSPLGSLHEQTTEGLRLVTPEDLKKTEDKTLLGEIMLIDMTYFDIVPLLSKGFTVINVMHGSSPKFDMGEIVADLRRAVRFIRQEALDYGIDPERLGLWGVSAGGHLSLLLGTTADIGNVEVVDEFEKNTGRVAAIVAYFPPTDFTAADATWNKDPEMLKEFPAMDFKDNQGKEFSPIEFVSSDDPPTLIIHGDKDPLVPIQQGESMYQALQKVGVESKFVSIPGAGHGFEGEDANRALAETVTWFEKHLVEK